MNSYDDTLGPTPADDASAGEHAWAAARLDDHLDGLLEPADARRLEAHLESCASCREEREGLARLLAATAELPRELASEHDLWPTIAAQLETTPRERTPSHHLWQAPWWQQVAAALLFTLLGSGLAGGFDHFLPPAAGPDSDPDGRPVIAMGSAEENGSFRRASSSNEAFVRAEAEYLRAKEGLWLAVYEHRDELSSLQLKLVERNLEVIDDAIRELRAALEDDPGNPQLQRLVLSSHRRGLDMLWDLVKDDRA